MAREFPVGTIRHWDSGDVIKAHNPIPPYSSGWIPLKTSPQLESIGRECDSQASTIKGHVMPINGEKFLDHEIDEFVDEHGTKMFVADDFKQYAGFYGAGYYSFRNEFSKRFMSNAMKLDKFINNSLADENERIGGDKNNDRLSSEEKKDIRARARLEFKESDNNFTVDKAEKLKKIIDRTLIQIKEELDFKDPSKKAVYDSFKESADSLPDYYLKIKEKRLIKNEAIKAIDKEFSDNWGVRESCKDYINKKFDEYVRKYSDQIAKDSLDDQMELFGVTVDMPTEEFYSKIYSKVKEFPDEDYGDFKELVYIRFLKKFNKSVEGDWKLDHIPAVHNLEKAINELPDGHFLTNDELNLITNKNYKGGSHGGYAWYSSSEKRINFSANCIGRGTVFGVLMNSTEFKSTLCHEIGHAVSKKLGRSDYYDYKKFVVESGWTYESKELRAGMTATGDQDDIPRTGSNSHVKLISEYAGKSPEEAFAEYYSFYVVNKERIDKYLLAGDKNFLKEQSKTICDTGTSERTIGSLGIYPRILSDYDDTMDRYNELRSRLTYGTHSKIELVSPWNTSLSVSEKSNISMSKLKARKDYSIDSMPPTVSYMDNGRNVVIDGATRVEVSKMNKKMLPSITITKELYHALKEDGFSDHKIADCMYTTHRHDKVLKEMSPQVIVHGLIHRDSLIPINVIVQNTNGLRTMAKIYKSKELEKALSDIFEKSVFEKYL